MHASWAGPPNRGSPRVRGKKARMEDGALETVRKLGGHGSLTQTLPLLREKAVVSLLKEMRFFFSMTTNPSTVTSQGAFSRHIPAFTPSASLL